ncbi:hypothetical protein J6590_028217 [Homalodisca vitripennis]|nr:hypothetical protein J6590_028217 [Homalodisca vitripennis]
MCDHKMYDMIFPCLWTTEIYRDSERIGYTPPGDFSDYSSTSRTVSSSIVWKFYSVQSPPSQMTFTTTQERFTVVPSAGGVTSITRTKHAPLSQPSRPGLHLSRYVTNDDVIRLRDSLVVPSKLSYMLCSTVLRNRSLLANSFVSSILYHVISSPEPDDIHNYTRTVHSGAECRWCHIYHPHKTCSALTAKYVNSYRTGL